MLQNRSRLLAALLALTALTTAARAGEARAPYTVELPDKAAVDLLRAHNLPVLDAGGPGRREALLTVAEAGALRARGLRLRPVSAPPPAPGLSPEAVASALRALAARAPDQATLFTLGESGEGRPILGLRIGRGDRARWRVLGAHHGDEASSVDLALAVATRLIDDADVDPEVRWLLDNDTVWVVPVVNPDGVAAGTRANAAGIDLNRNYGEQWREDEWASGDGPFSEPETRAIRMWASTQGFAAGLSMHSGAANLGWVWNWTTSRSPDEALLREIAADYAAQAEVPDFWITNGADWYRTFGDTTDWAYARQGTLDFTLEVSELKAPPRDDIPAIIDGHLDAVMGFLMQPGLAAGRVVDAETGRPLVASLRLQSGGATFAADPAGRFARVLGAPEALVEVSSPGYASLSQVLRADETVELALQPLGRCSGLLVVGPDGALSGEALDAPPGPATLRRFGEAAVEVQLDDPAALTALDLLPGPYDVERGGALCPRALWTAGAERDQLDLEIDAQEDIFEISIPPIEGPPTAYLFYGPDRAWTPAPLRAVGPGRYALERAALPTDEPRVELLVLSGGRAAAVLDLGGAAQRLEPGTEPAAAGQATQWRDDALSPYGCASSPRGLPLGILVSLLALLLRRSPT